MSEATTLDAMEFRQLAGRTHWLQRIALCLRHVMEFAVLGYVLLGLCATLRSPISGSGFWDFLRPPKQPLTWQALWGGPALITLTVLIGYALSSPFKVLFPLFEKLLERPFYLLAAFLAVVGVIYNYYIWSQALHLKMPLWLRDSGMLGHNDWIAVDFAAAPLLMVMLVSARFFKRPAPLALFLFTLFTGAFGLIFYFKSWPVITQIMREYNEAADVIHPAQRPGLMVSIFFLPIGSVLKVLVPLLAAFYGVRRGFAWWKYLLGWVAGFFVTHLILLQSFPRLIDTRFVLLGWLWLALLARLPLTRRNLESILGVKLHADAAPAAMAASSVFASIVGHAMAVVLGLLLLAFGVIDYYEQKMVELIVRGPEPPRYSPALVNAYDTLKAGFNKELSAPFDLRGAGEFGLLESVGPAARRDFDEVWAAIDIPALERQLAVLQPGFDAFAATANADYCLFHDGKRRVTPHFVNLRQVSRGLMIRASLRLHQGRPAEALPDIESLLRVAGLLNTDPCGTLVHHMIATAIRGIGLAAAQQYYLYYRQDPAALEPLRAMLERNARWVRADFPDQIITRGEAAYLPVVPCFEMVVPGLVKCGTVFYGRWMQYDFILISIGLEKYKRDHGAYPATLDALAPAYIDRIPRDPVQGRPYIYENLGGEFKLRAAPLPNERKGKAEETWTYTSSPDSRVQHTLLERHLKSRPHQPKKAIYPAKPA